MDEITFIPTIIECANDVVMDSEGNLDNVSAIDDLLDQKENASVKEETTKKSSLSDDLVGTRDASMEGMDDQNEDSEVQKDIATSDTRYEETLQTDAKKERSPVQEDKDCEVTYFVEVTSPKIETKRSSLLSKYRSIQKETNTEITNNSRLVRIVNLPENVTESSLENLISRNHPLVGNIKKIYVREDKSLRLVYAFVLFEHVSDASKVAQDWQNYTYEDKKLDVALIGPKLPYKKYKEQPKPQVPFGRRF